MYTQIAYEAIANIRTVASLGLEERMGNLFEEKILGPHKYVNPIHGHIVLEDWDQMHQIYLNTIYKYRKLVFKYTNN